MMFQAQCNGKIAFCKMNFSVDFASASTIWYPASGTRSNVDGDLGGVGYNGFYWSVTPSSFNAYNLGFSYDGDVYPTNYNSRAYGFSVRCLQVTD